jgi:probable F420-dependent oxidoreductase
VHGPDAVADLYRRIDPARFVVGLGGPQQPRPMRALNAYLDHLDRALPPVPAERRMLAALGPRKLELARERSAGAIMLLVTPAYLGDARRLLGDERALVVDQMLVLDTDAGRARTTARRSLRLLSGLQGYRNSFARMGFTDQDIADLSDRLVDRLIAWGDVEAIAARVDEYRRCGADQVVLHVLADGDQPGPIEVARAFAGKLSSAGGPSAR